MMTINTPVMSLTEKIKALEPLLESDKLKPWELTFLRYVVGLNNSGHVVAVSTKQRIVISDLMDDYL